MAQHVQKGIVKLDSLFGVVADLAPFPVCLVHLLQSLFARFDPRIVFSLGEERFVLDLAGSVDLKLGSVKRDIQPTLICSRRSSCFLTSSSISSLSFSYFSNPRPKMSSNHSVLTSPVPPWASRVASFSTSGRMSSELAIWRQSAMMRARWDIRSSSSSREARSGRTEGGSDENPEADEVVEGM